MTQIQEQLLSKIGGILFFPQLIFLLRKLTSSIFDRNIIIRNDTIQIYHNNLSMNRILICTSERMFF